MIAAESQLLATFARYFSPTLPCDDTGLIIILHPTSAQVVALVVNSESEREQIGTERGEMGSQ